MKTILSFRVLQNQTADWIWFRVYSLPSLILFHKIHISHQKLRECFHAHRPVEWLGSFAPQDSFWGPKQRGSDYLGQVLMVKVIRSQRGDKNHAMPVKLP